MRHVLIIGRPTLGPANADTNAVFRTITTPRLIVRRCSNSSELLAVLQTVAAEGLIDMLDIYDHGDAGKQALGDDMLFSSDADPTSELVGADIACSLRPLLSPLARLRLLGCNTGLGHAGRLLVFKLSVLLGQHRLVFATNGGTDQNDFDEDGFNRNAEVSYLVDSLSVIDHPTTGHNDRILNYRALCP